LRDGVRWHRCIAKSLGNLRQVVYRCGLSPGHGCKQPNSWPQADMSTQHLEFAHWHCLEGVAHERGHPRISAWRPLLSPCVKPFPVWDGSCSSCCVSAGGYADCNWLPTPTSAPTPLHPPLCTTGHASAEEQVHAAAAGLPRSRIRRHQQWRGPHPGHRHHVTPL
jgi:hypothetical protein